MKAYLFGSIFYDKDIMYNEMLAKGIRQAFPFIDMYVPQEATINDKSTFADSKMIYEGDYNRLKDTDLLIGCLDGDLPPIGSVTELGIFSELAKNNPNKKAIILHTDTRDASRTYSDEKVEDMKTHLVSSQFNYFNLFTKGVAESCGVIVGSKEQLFEYVHELYTDYRKNNHWSGIYKITNRVNGKFYIGLSTDILRRLNSHRWVKTDNPQVIDQAIQLHGIENFTAEILELCPEDKLSEREKYWCDEYYQCKSYAPNGYNIASTGGQFGTHGITLSCYDLDGNLIQTYPSYQSAADAYNITPHAIVLSIDRQGLCCGMMWQEGNEKKISKYIKRPNPKGRPIDVYTKEGVFFRTFDNETAAGEYFGTSIGNIHSVLNGTTSMCDYYFVDAGEEFSLNVLQYRNHKRVYCYNMDTHEFVAEYKTAQDAGQSIGCDASGIAKACKGQNYYYKKLIWSYKKFDRIPDNYIQINQQIWEEIKAQKKVEGEF